MNRLRGLFGARENGDDPRPTDKSLPEPGAGPGVGRRRRLCFRPSALKAVFEARSTGVPVDPAANGHLENNLPPSTYGFSEKGFGFVPTGGAQSRESPARVGNLSREP